MLRKRLLLLALLLSSFIPLGNTSLSEKSDDSDCQVEGFRFYEKAKDFIAVEGSTTCPEGWIYIRMFDGSGENARYLGNAEGKINGYSFEIFADFVTVPEVLSIKYSINEDY